MHLVRVLLIQKMGYDDFVMERCWVNYPKKYEFNSLHTHNGSFSFVIFLQHHPIAR